MKKVAAIFTTMSVAFALCSCGGGGTNPSGVSGGTVAVAGGVPRVSASTTTTVAASPDASPKTVTIEGKTYQVPANITEIPAGTSVAIIPAGTTLLAGLELGTALSRTPGDIIVQMDEGYTETWVNGVTNTGAIRNDVALWPGKYRVTLVGPYNIRPTGKASDPYLTVKRLSFRFEVKTDGTASLPTEFLGYMPTNGTKTNMANAIVASYIPAAFNNQKVGLSLTKPGQTLKKTTIAKGTSARGAYFQFQDLTGPDFTIPTTGLDSVFLNCLEL